MRLLIVGARCREHAVASELRKSVLLTEVFFWPMNPAFSSMGKPLGDLNSSANFAALVTEIKRNKIDLVVVGPEAPLSEGLSDYLNEHKIPVFGPCKKAAQLESSKLFAKEVMKAAQIPTAQYAVCNNLDDLYQMGLQFMDASGVVLKADGLAQGKGVFVCKNVEELQLACASFKDANYIAKEASSRILVEKFLKGRECSYFAMVDSQNLRFKSLGFAVDYKRIFDKDEGLNTGGMGAYTPVNWLPANFQNKIENQVVLPLISALNKFKIPYLGFLYVGLMVQGDDFNVVEFNVRLGDPEAQVLSQSVLFRWLDQIAYFLGLVGSEPKPLVGAPCAAVAVVLASNCYPQGKVETISYEFSPELFHFSIQDRVKVFAGSLQKLQSKLLSLKGRILTVTASADDLASARKIAYEKIQEIAEDKPLLQFRKDIAQLENCDG